MLGFAYERRLMKVLGRRSRDHLHRQVTDPQLRAKLTPSYMFGCKRILISDDYYPSLTQPNVEVVTDRVREVRASSVVTEDGTEREVDTIIFATGLHVTDMPAAAVLRGRDGRLLADAWQDGQSAYLGTTIAGFPNLFMLAGPDTGLGHSSMVIMIEAQIGYVMDCLRVMDERGLNAVEVRRDAQAAFNARLQSQMHGTVWTAGGCNSWYLDASGRNTTLWPDFTGAFASSPGALTRPITSCPTTAPRAGPAPT